MNQNTLFTIRVALIVALGGFLMGFDASVISGVVGFVEPQFQLTQIQLGWVVASLTLTATLAMMVSGPLSDRFGRRPVLKVAALLFGISAVASAVAPDFATLVVARMLGGFGVGAALIIAPVYIAEISPPDIRGRMVSFNQLNIVLGISAAYFSNYLILGMEFGESAWRWMLGVEAIPAVIYLLALYFVPESPRWLVMQDREDEALSVMERSSGPERARTDLAEVHDSLHREAHLEKGSLKDLFSPAMRLVIIVGVTIGILQQITGINSVFFYAPMIFEQSGIGTNAAFMQAVLVGIINVVFTVAAILLIDRLGRKPLLLIGLTGIAACMLLLSWGFGTAIYTIPAEALASLPAETGAALQALVGQTFDSDVAFRQAVVAAIGGEAWSAHSSSLVNAAITMNPTLILVGILGFVASFSISLGPVMWVLFSELFPNRVRGIAISFVGLINSSVSFLVQLVFPWELENLGSSMTFLIYGVFAVLGLFFVLRVVPETKGRSLEQLESELVR